LVQTARGRGSGAFRNAPAKPLTGIGAEKLFGFIRAHIYERLYGPDGA
jgi:hypothetical protein